MGARAGVSVSTQPPRPGLGGVTSTPHGSAHVLRTLSSVASCSGEVAVMNSVIKRSVSGCTSSRMALQGSGVGCRAVGVGAGRWVSGGVVIGAG